MEFLLNIFVIFLLLVGLIGSFVPAIPGPSVSYISLLVFHFFTSYEISTANLLICALIAILVTIFDFLDSNSWCQKVWWGKKSCEWIYSWFNFGIIIYTRNWDNYRPFTWCIFRSANGSEKFNDAIKIAFGAFCWFYSWYFIKVIIFNLYNIHYN